MYIMHYAPKNYIMFVFFKSKKTENQKKNNKENKKKLNYIYMQLS